MFAISAVSIQAIRHPNRRSTSHQVEVQIPISVEIPPATSPAQLTVCHLTGINESTSLRHIITIQTIWTVFIVDHIEIEIPIVIVISPRSAQACITPSHP